MNLAKRLGDILEKPERTVIGLMSGMSMDGVDLACVGIRGSFPDVAVDLKGTHFRAYPEAVKERLRAGQTAGVSEVSALSFLVAEEFSLSVAEFLAKSGMKASDIDAIGSHGQTLFHSSPRPDHGKGEPGISSTLQVGHPSIIAERTGITTIGNFRVRDIAAGGQGAPLVPFADYVLYRTPGATVAVNNLGSISNVTVVPPDIQNLLAFDTGPANMAIDYFARRFRDSGGIDKDGAVSAQGRVIEPLLQVLLQLPFFRRKPPKAAGYDDFGPAVLDRVAEPYRGSPMVDLVRTGVELAAITIGDAYRHFVLPRYPELKKVTFSGGGT